MEDSYTERIWELNSIRTGPQGETPVILIHPVGLDLTYWDAQIEALRDHYDVVAFDLPGQGTSPGRPEDWTIPKTVSFLQQIVESTGSSKVHLVGLSVGGIVAQAFALAKPECVRSLALIDTAPTFSEQGRETMRRRAATVRAEGMQAVIQACFDRWFTDETKTRRPDLLDRIKKTLLADDPNVHAAMWDMISAFEVTAQLHQITVPTLILTGEFDVSSPPSSATLMHQEIAGSEIHIVPGYSHMLPLEASDVVNDYLLDFLARVSA